MSSWKKLLCLLFFLKGSVSVTLVLDDGVINGTSMVTRLGESFDAFLKLPFAEPPLGDLRFVAPEVNRPWSGVLDATQYSSMCMQINLLSSSPVSEDCLYLNVFTKNLREGSENLKPVIAYIHGGSFQLGSASDHEPHLLMERDVVVVTINYRLGAFGFLSLGTKEIPGNAGFKDQVMALKWIKKNISKFGGDPNLVTLIGNSAGAYSVTAHMVSPSSQGLFHRVIAMSGSITNQRKLENNYLSLAQMLAEKLNCTKISTDEMIACLRNVPAADFNFIELREYPACTIMTWFPVVENDFGQEMFLADDPVSMFRSANFSKVPIIIGRTKDEFMDIPMRMLQNPITTELNERFDKVAPHCFFYEVGTEKSKQISEQLKESYFYNEIIDIRSFDGLSRAFSDGYIGYGVHRLAHLISNFTEVFYYQLSYIGRYSFYLYPHGKPYGVHHSDEMQYIMTTAFVGPQIKLSDPENLMVERFTRLIAQFALTGNPNSETDEFLTEMSWPKHESDNEYYLDIGSHLIEKHGLSLERYSVWEKLETRLATSSGIDRKLNLIFLLVAFICAYLSNLF